MTIRLVQRLRSLSLSRFRLYTAMADALPQLLHALAALLAASAVCAVVTLCASTCVRCSQHHKRTSSRSDPTIKRAVARPQQLPCPRSTLPLLDMAVWQRERLYDWFLEQCELHRGPWRLQALGRLPAIVIASSELFEDVLKTQFDSSRAPRTSARSSATSSAAASSRSTATRGIASARSRATSLRSQR